MKIMTDNIQTEWSVRACWWDDIWAKIPKIQRPEWRLFQVQAVEVASRFLDKKILGIYSLGGKPGEFMETITS